MDSEEMDITTAAKYLKDNSTFRINEEKDLEFTRKAQADEKKYKKALKKLRENPTEVKDKILQSLKSEGYIIQKTGNPNDIIASDKPHITNFTKETKKIRDGKELQDLSQQQQAELSPEEQARLEAANKETKQAEAQKQAEEAKNKVPEKSGIEFVLNLYGISLKRSRK